MKLFDWMVKWSTQFEQSKGLKNQIHLHLYVALFNTHLFVTWNAYLFLQFNDIFLQWFLLTKTECIFIGKKGKLFRHWCIIWAAKQKTITQEESFDPIIWKQKKSNAVQDVNNEWRF